MSCLVVILTGIDWDNLRSTRPPFQPQVSGPDDTSNFDIDELRPPNNKDALGPSTVGSKESMLNVHLPFVGFTCTLSTAKKFYQMNQANNQLLNNLYNQNVASVNNNHNAPYNHVIVNHDNNVTVIETIDSDSGTMSETKNDINSGDNQLQLEKLESDLLLARQEWSEVSLKLGEMRKEKSSLSFKLRSKEEEIEQQLEKNNDLRQQLRTAERIKRQQLEEIIVLQTDLDKERQTRIDGKILYSLMTILAKLPRLYRNNLQSSWIS